MAESPSCPFSGWRSKSRMNYRGLGDEREPAGANGWQMFTEASLHLCDHKREERCGWVSVVCVCLSCTFWPVLKKKTLHSVFTVRDVWWMSLSAVARKPKHWPGLSASHPDGPGLSCHGGPRASGRSEGPQKFIHPIDFHSPQWWIGSLTGSLSQPRDSSGLRVGAGGAQVTGNPAQIVLKLLF